MRTLALALARLCAVVILAFGAALMVGASSAGEATQSIAMPMPTPDPHPSAEVQP